MSDRLPIDPRPQPPEKPLLTDCCESGCEVCVFDAYANARAAYKQALREWEARRSARESTAEQSPQRTG